MVQKAKMQLNSLILVWDATCVDNFAPPHRALTAREPQKLAMDTEHKK